MPKGTAVGLSLPTGGLRRDLPRHFVPDDASYDLNNVFVYDGKLQTRYGFRDPYTNQPGTRIMGLLSYVFIGNQFTVAVKNVAATSIGLWVQDGSGWTDITDPGQFSGGVERPVRMVVFPISGTLHLLAVNGIDPPIKWDNNPANDFTTLGGSPPTQAMDITVCSNQVILLVNINDDTFVRISSVNDAESWPATKVAILSETQDGGVAVKRLTRTSFVVYKNNSQWLATSQPGTTLGFRFELIDTKPGPISMASVVDVGGSQHYYIGTDFRIYRFDGSRCQEVFPGLRPFIQENLNYSRRWRSHGSYYHLLDKIIFWFPMGAGDDPSGGLILDPRTGAGFPFSVGFETITASSPYLVTLDLLLGSTSGNVFIHDRAAFADGDGEVGEVPIAAYWETPLRAYGGPSQLSRVHFCDTFFELPGIPQEVFVQYGKTDTLATTPSFDAGTAIDINVNTRHKIPPAPEGSDLVARWICTLHSYATNGARVNWVGGLLSTDSVSLD